MKGVLIMKKYALRLAALSLIAVLMFAFVACKKKPANDPTTTASAAKTTAATTVEDTAAETEEATTVKA
jgi:hypothetical protein